jgi:hypothetical protein
MYIILERVVEFLNPILDTAGLAMTCVVQNALMFLAVGRAIFADWQPS